MSFDEISFFLSKFHFPSQTAILMRSHWDWVWNYIQPCKGQYRAKFSNSAEKFRYGENFMSSLIYLGLYSAIQMNLRKVFTAIFDNLIFLE